MRPICQSQTQSNCNSGQEAAVNLMMLMNEIVVLREMLIAGQIMST